MVYKTLYNIDILHAYFLDRGNKKYHTTDVTNELSDDEKEDAEKNYSTNNFIQILPNQKTKEIAKNHKLLIRNHHKGIRILASTIKLNAAITTQNGTTIEERYNPIIKLSDDLVLTFYIKATDNFFENYTAMIDRKENQLYYFSNINSTANNAFDAISNIETLDRFLISTKETRRLLYQLEIESEFTTSNPKGVSIANIAIDKIDEIEAKVVNAIELNEEEQNIFNALNQAVSILKNSKIIGVIQLKISGDNTTDFTEILNTENESNEGVFDVSKQCLLGNEIAFKIYIENKKTFWRYHQKSKNEVMVTNNEHPLTKNGSVDINKANVTPQPSGTVFFPNPTIASITKESENYYSDIYITNTKI